MVVFLLSFFSSRNSIPVLMAILLWLSVHEDLGNGCIFAQFLFFEELHSSLDGHISLISVTCPEYNIDYSKQKNFSFYYLPSQTQIPRLRASIMKASSGLS